MNIISKGTLPADRVWVGRCQSCNSKAEAKESELGNIQEQPQCGRYSWQKCPVCNSGTRNFGFGGMLFYPRVGY